MGAWSAPVSQKPVAEELEVAVHLPCNVVVQETGSSAIVAALDPADSFEASDEQSLETAGVAREALGRALQRIADSG
jgi:hypothetical protein